MAEGFLGAAEARAIAEQRGIRPAKQWGQNFVIDANTVRRIVRLARVTPGDVVLEVGPGLGSLTLGLLAAGAEVVAVEIDPVLAEALPATVAELRPQDSARLTVIADDAMRVVSLPKAPTCLVANLPYNVAVPIVLHLLATFPGLERGLVMVQAEVADRLVAAPGSRIYGVPSVKLAWFARGERAGAVPASVFWPVPRVESQLVSFERRPPPESSASREEVFACVDAAFGQRRKTLRSALSAWAGSPPAAESALRAAGVDPSARGESLTVEDFARIAAARSASGMAR